MKMFNFDDVDELVGRRVMLEHTTDQYTLLELGSTGTIIFVDDMHTVHVKWDDGSRLGLIPNIDKWHLLD